MGGAPLSLLYLIEQLDPRRFLPEVLFLGAGGEEVELYRRHGIPVHLRSDISIFPHARNAFLALRSLRPWEVVTRALQIVPSARRMRDFLRGRPFDLVHLNTSTLLPAGVGAAWAGLPVVWHVREPLHPGLLGLRRRLVRDCIRRCSRAILAISRFDGEPWEGESALHVVYNFVNFDQFDRRRDGRSFRHATGLPADRPIVGMLGGVIHSKGADVLVEAAARVRSTRPDVLFVIAGYPPTDAGSPSRLKRGVRRLLERSGALPSVERRVLDLMSLHGLDDTVRFVGMRSDVPDLLAACSVLVWPATVSHFARPIIEAGAMGRPVVASDLPSSRELVRHGTTGLLVPPSDADALAKAILELVGSAREARRMGDAGYALARERYDARRNASAVIAIYDSILAESAHRGVAG